MLILNNQKKSRVWTETDVVWKQYFNGFKGFTAQEIFDNEVGALSLLKGAPGTPQILNLNREEKKFSMKWAGENMQSPKEIRDPQYWRERIYSSLTTMGIQHNDICLANILILNGRPTLIDFEVSTYEGSPLENRVKAFDDNRSLKEVLGA